MGQEKKMVELMDCELAPLELNQEKVCCAEEPPYHLLKRESLGLISWFAPKGPFFSLA